MSSGLRIVVLGYLIRGPLGGLAWHHLQYVAGLARLGHDVWFVEDSDDYPSCYDPLRDVTDADPAYGLGFAKQAFGAVGLPERWAYNDAHCLGWLGPAGVRAEAICRSADVVLNLSGLNPLRPWVENVPTRVYVDTDPGFTQVRHLLDPGARERAAAHTAFFTFAENVGGSALLPEDGFPWQPTRQPVVLDLWPETRPPADGAFTTVMLWDSYPAVEIDGLTLGLKSESFAPFLGLPALAKTPLELALGGATAPRESLSGHGWRVLDSREPTRTLESYQRYLRASRGEFSVAKHGYVVTRSGWFSERSANYLATGRPVVAQDTGFSEVLPVGEGLLAFTSLDEAVDAIADAELRYAVHQRAARSIASAFFGSDHVLADLLERVFAVPAGAG
jgi:hypothetical protein